MVTSGISKTKTKRDGLYIHPKGSIARPTKVSCASCISGHRSGACDHYDRVLLQIRAAGRPSTTCHHQSSCGGACLQQRAFIIPNEAPHWCGEHRSCIENWEHSDRCPPYPVSSTKSAKRKERSNSPQVPDSTSPISPTSNSRRASNGTNPLVPLTCASEHGRNGKLSSLSSTIPISVAAPGMAKASQSVPATPWASTEVEYSYPTTGYYNRPHPILPHPTPTLSIPPTSFAESATLNSVSPSFDMPLSHVDFGPWNPVFDPFLTSFSFDPPEPPHHLTSPLSKNPFSSPATVSTAPASYIPTAAAPLRQRSSPRQTQPQQTHPCPGNGFQCPCDENCMCQDCYTHGRGWWTLPFSFSDMPQENHQSTAPHIAMPPSTFPEALQSHAFPYDDFGGAWNKTFGAGLEEEDEDDTKDQALLGSKGSCCQKLDYDNGQT